MSGRILNTILICVVSGLLIKNLMSATGLTAIQGKASEIGMPSSDSEILRAEASPAGFGPSRDRWEAGLHGNELFDQGGLGEQPIRPPDRLSGKMKRHDPALAISVESVLRKRKAMEEVVFVDVRDSGRFEECRIPGSINVPLYAVKTKKFLASRMLVLVNEGFKRGELEARCRQMRERGFMIWILQGGLNAWREAGAPLEGLKAARENLTRISPNDVFEERDYEGWIAVDARMPKQSGEPSPFLRAPALGSPDKESQWVAALVRQLKHKQSEVPPVLVVFNDDGQRYEEVAKVIRKAGIKNAFYLEDGLAGYKAYIARQAAVIPKRDHQRRIIDKCSGCL